MTGELATALAVFQQEMPTVPKSHTAKVPMKAGGSYSYKYADLADVTEAAMPLLAKNGLSFSSCPRAAERGYELVGVLLHSSGEKLEGSLPIGGNSPQEIGSSLTYMRRYLLGCLTGLVTDNDDDGQLAQTATRKPKAAATNPPPPVETGEAITAKTRAQMFALFGQKGIAESEQLSGINAITGKEYTSRGDLTEADAKTVIIKLKQRPDVDTEPDPDADYLAAVAGEA